MFLYMEWSSWTWATSTYLIMEAWVGCGLERLKSRKWAEMYVYSSGYVLVYECCKCGARHRTLIWRNDGWYCLLCLPSMAMEAVPESGDDREWTAQTEP